MITSEVLNMTLYHCPGCDRIHDEPYDATFSLFARCIDCGIDDECAA